MKFTHFSLKMIIYLVIILFLSISSLPAVDPPPNAPQTVIHPYQKGGMVEEWLVIGPFSLAKGRTSVRGRDSLAGPEIRTSDFDHDFLTPMGGERKAVIKKYSSVRTKTEDGGRKYIKARQVRADTRGVVSLDSLFPGEHDAVFYAFCMVEVFVPCSVRCYWGAGGKSKIWIDGRRQYPAWESGDSSLLLQNYGDGAFTEGLHAVLLKMAASRHQRFTCELWDVRDSLVPYQKRIHSLYCTLDTHAVRTGADSITATLCFNIPVPKTFFTGRVTVCKETWQVDASQQMASYTVPVGGTCRIGIADSLHGVVSVRAAIKPDTSRTLQSVRYVWKGDFEKDKDSLSARCMILGKKGAPTDRGSQFIKMLSSGALSWATDWFKLYDSLSSDAQVRQLGYVQMNTDVVALLHKGTAIPGNISYPLYLPSVARHRDERVPVYEPSQWLNYKYPEKYILSRDIQGADQYRFWLFLPKSIVKKRKKIPLILSLSGADGRGYDIDILKDFGPGGYAVHTADFPFAVVTPQCRYHTLWDAQALKQLLDTLLASGRFDPDKIFITGTGMGAFTTWHLACTFPDFFAGIMPINGGGDKEKACVLKKMPVWAFHGGRNNVVPLELTQDMVTAIKECGGTSATFSVYTEGDHSVYADIYDDTRIYRWFKRPKKK